MFFYSLNYFVPSHFANNLSVFVGSFFVHFTIFDLFRIISYFFTIYFVHFNYVPPRTSSFSFISIFRMRVVMSSANCCHKVTFFHIRIFTTTWSSKYKDLIIIRHSKCHLEHSYLKRFSLPYQNSVSQFLFFSFFLSLFFNGRSALKMNES